MAELFSNEWINRLKDLWNETPEVSDKLAEINLMLLLHVVIRMKRNQLVFCVENGKAVSAGLYNDEP